MINITLLGRGEIDENLTIHVFGIENGRDTPSFLIVCVLVFKPLISEFDFVIGNLLFLEMQYI